MLLCRQTHGREETFSRPTFNPIFLWKISDRLLFEGELELELEERETSLSLEMAQVSYLVNGYMTLGAGKFLNSMDYFVERQHMAWVNKLPDKPLAVYDGLAPESLVGVQLRGGIPIGNRSTLSCTSQVHHQDDAALGRIVIQKLI